MARHNTAYRRRGGFTLVEMLVSTALIIFVLLIITTVFTTGIGALRALRGAGHLQDEVRHATAALRRDLAAPHFGRETDALHGPNLSQQRLDLYDWTPPKQGFFRIWQGGWQRTNPFMKEFMEDINGIVTNDINGDNIIDYKDAAPDGDGMISYLATDQALHFTVRAEPNTAQGTGRDSYSSTKSPIPATVLAAIMPAMSRPDYLNNDGLIYSPWTEVAYFLRPSNQQAGSTPLYTLYRRRRVLLDIPSSVAASNNGRIANSSNATPQLTDVSLYEPDPQNPAGYTYFNTPADITAPFRRLAMKPLPTGPLPPGAQQPAGVFNNAFYRSLFDDNPNQTVTGGAASPGGDDILLENVLSFEIKVSWDVTNDMRLIRTANGINPPASFVPKVAGATPNPEYPFDNLPVQATWSQVGNNVLSDAGIRIFDTWRGEDYVDPVAGTVPYSRWNQNYEISSTPPDEQYDAVSIPLRIRVKAIQIRIRVWDAKTQQTRQVTVIQDL